jgi:hypothetical protein
MSSIVSTAPIADIVDNGITKPIAETETKVDAETETKVDSNTEKKEKKQNLPAKYMKNMTFGYWFLLRLKDNGVISEDAYNTAFADFLKPFANVADQTSLYESFENDTKMITKDLKKLIKDFHKPPKVKKEKEKGVKGRKKKAKDAEDACDTDMVSRIVYAALNEDSKEEVKPKRKYTRKPKAPKEEVPKEEAPKEEAPKEEAPKEEAPKEEAPKEEAPKEEVPKEEAPKEEVPKEEAPKEEAPKEEAPKEEAPKEEAHKECHVNNGELVEEEYEEVEEEIETQEFTFKDGFMCLLDTNNLALYDRKTHQPITSHTLQRISLPDGSSMLLDHDKNTYME